MNNAVNYVDFMGLISCSECEKFKQSIREDVVGLCAVSGFRGFGEGIFGAALGLAVGASGGTAAPVAGVIIAGAGTGKGIVDAGSDIQEAMDIGDRAAILYAKCIAKCE